MRNSPAETRGLLNNLQTIKSTRAPCKPVAKHMMMHFQMSRSRQFTGLKTKIQNVQTLLDATLQIRAPPIKKQHPDVWQLV